MPTIKMAVSKTVEGKREEIGVIDLYAPDLKEFGLAYEPKETDEKTGELVYEDLTASFLYSAILAATKANARNKLKNGTVELRPGASLPTTLVELVTPSEGNRGQSLVERRTLIGMFKEWAAALEKPQALKDALVILFDKPENLALQDADKRTKIKPYFEDFGNAVAERLTDWQVNYIQNVLSQCDAEEIQW